MAATYRRVTRKCAKDDWGCRTHTDVLANGSRTDLLKQFLKQTPETWFTKEARRDRARSLKPRQPRPGPRIIGSTKTEGFRAWVWEDDGSVYDVTGSFPGFKLYWMIAYGNRRRGDRSDLQEKRKALLQDPHDTWRPVDLDYADLVDEVDRDFGHRAQAAIKEAVRTARQQHNALIPIPSTDIAGNVIHEHTDVDVVEGIVVEEWNERWLLLAKMRPNGRPLTWPMARDLAAAAYPTGVIPGMVNETSPIRDLLVANPETHFIFYHDLSEEPDA